MAKREGDLHSSGENTDETGNTDNQKTGGLISVESLIAGKNLPDWQVKAFAQYSGWKKGKTVTEADFNKKFGEFAKKYLGGGDR